jgi:hypothetical protein
MENYLENKKVSIKLVQKYRTGFDKGSDGSTLYTGCKQVFQLPTNAYDRLIPILTPEEQEAFEDKLGLTKGELAFNNKENGYWRTFKVTLDKKGKVLNLNDPEDYLSYRILRVCNAVANSKDEINVLQHTFYMETDEEENNTNSRMAERYEEASKLFGVISKSDKKMKNVLRVLGKTLTSDSNSKWLKAELVKMIEQKAKVPGVLNIDDFIRTASDPDIDMKVFILDALDIGEIKIDGTTYKLRAGDILGYDFAQAVSFFNNPKNQQTKLLIEDKVINNSKK